MRTERAFVSSHFASATCYSQRSSIMTLPVFAEPVGAPAFHYRDGVLHAENVALPELADKLGTPLYVYSRAALHAAWERYRTAIEGRNALVCFGMKANSNLAVLKEFARA